MRLSLIVVPVLAALLGSATAHDTGSTFTECMRAHGLPDFPTATVDTDGRIVLTQGGTGFDPFSTTYRDALKACAGPARFILPTEPTPPSAPAAPPVPAAPTVR